MRGRLKITRRLTFRLNPASLTELNVSCERGDLAARSLALCLFICLASKRPFCWKFVLMRLRAHLLCRVMSERWRVFMTAETFWGGPRGGAATGLRYRNTCSLWPISERFFFPSKLMKDTLIGPKDTARGEQSSTSTVRAQMDNLML